MSLPLDGNGPLFRQVYRALRDAIAQGALPAGRRLPPTRILAGELGLSRTTVMLAYEQLTAEGYLEGRQGSGTYVRAAPAPTARPQRLRAVTLSAFGERLRETRRLPLESAYANARPTLRWDFRHGMPSLADFPVEAWQRCLGRRARRASARAYDYGPPQGSRPLREALAGYLARARGVVCSPDQIVVVTGSQQALDLAARLLLDPGDRAIVEEPGYEGASNAFRAAGAEIVPVTADMEGLVTTALPDARLAHVTPSHQFPLGGVLSWARRVALLSWAEARGAWVIEDDYDGEYRFDGRPIAALKSLDDGERVLYVGTFSKVMFPALRLGYVVVPPALVDAVARAKVLADGGSARLEQDALADFIDGGAFERHVRRSRNRNAERRALLLDAVERHLGDRAEVVGANAGLHVVMWLPELPGRSTGRIVRKAAEEGVGVYAVTPHYATPPANVGLILGYGGIATRDVAPGIARLARAVG